MPGCVMSMPTSGGKKYTVEQAELIRRLRNSGMTKEQVLMAFESFDLIDQCIGNLVNISSLTQKPGTSSSSVAVLAENLINRQAALLNIATSNPLASLQSSLLSSLKLPQLTAPLMSPIIPVSLNPQTAPPPAASASAALVTQPSLVASLATQPISSASAIAGISLQPQLSTASQPSNVPQQQAQVLQFLQQLGLLASNSITAPVSAAAGTTTAKAPSIPSLSSLPLGLTQAISQNVLGPHPLPQQLLQQQSQLLSPPLPHSQQHPLQLQLPQQLQSQLQQAHSSQPAAAVVNLPPVLQQLIQQQSQQNVVQQLQQLLTLQQLQQQQLKHPPISLDPQAAPTLQQQSALIASLLAAAAASQHQQQHNLHQQQPLPSALLSTQLAHLPLQQQFHQQHQQPPLPSLATATTTHPTIKAPQSNSNLHQHQEQLLQQIIKQLNSNSHANANNSSSSSGVDRQLHLPVAAAVSSSNNLVSQPALLPPAGEDSIAAIAGLNPPMDDKLSKSAAAASNTGTANRRSFHFKNGLIKDDLEEDSTFDHAFLRQDEILCCEEIKEFTVVNNIKQHQIAALTGISQAYISRYLKGEFMGMSEKCCRTIKKWYLTYKNNPAAIEEGANRQQQLAASRLSELGDVAAPKDGGDFLSDSLLLPPATMVVTTPSSSSGGCGGGGSSGNGGGSSGLSYPRRERFVFRPNHLELLEKCFMEENYPSLRRREEIARACNVATEKLTGRALSDKEKVGVQTISNWFANKRKDLKRLFKEADGMEAASPFLTRTRGRPPLSQADVNFFSSFPSGLSIFNHSKINVPDQQHSLNGGGVDGAGGGYTGTEVVIGQSNENLLLGDAEVAALQLSVETAAVNQAIYSLTGQLPILPPPPQSNKKGGVLDVGQPSAEFLAGLIANYKSSLNGGGGGSARSSSSDGNHLVVGSNGAIGEVNHNGGEPPCNQTVVRDRHHQGSYFAADGSGADSDTGYMDTAANDESAGEVVLFPNGGGSEEEESDAMFDDIITNDDVAMNCELDSNVE